MILLTIGLMLVACILPFSVQHHITENTYNNTLSLDYEPNNDNISAVARWFTENQGQIPNSDIYLTYVHGGVSFMESAVLFRIGEGILSDMVKISFPGANLVTPVGVGKLEHTTNYFLGNDPDSWHIDVINYERVLYQDLYPKIDLQYYISGGQLKYDWIVRTGGDFTNIKQRFGGATSVVLEPSGELLTITPHGEIHEAAPKAYQKKDDVECDFLLVDKTTISYFVGEYDHSEPLVIDPLIFTAFVGGDDNDQGNAIALDTAGNAYDTGSTSSTDFPISTGVTDESHNGLIDVFVLKLSNDGSKLLWCTYIGGTDADEGFDIALDNNGVIYVTGNTYSENFPTTAGANDTTFNGGDGDVFVFKLSSDGKKLIYSTFVGGSDTDSSKAIVVDNNGNAHVTGYTYSLDFSITDGANDTSYNGGMDVFVFKLSNDGTTLLYSTYIGHDSSEWGRSITIDLMGDVYVTGKTRSTEFPTSDITYDDTHNGRNDVFIFKLNNIGSRLVYSTFFGGNDDDSGTGIELSSTGEIVITGYTESDDFPTTNNSYKNTLNGSEDVFISRFNKDGTNLSISTYIGGNEGETAFDIALDKNENIYIAVRTASEDYPTTIDAFDRSYNGIKPEFGDADDIAISQLSKNATELMYSTFIGGTGNDEVRGLAIDNRNSVYISGSTGFHGFPTIAGAYNVSDADSANVFILKLQIKAPNNDDDPSSNDNDDSGNLLGLSTSLVIAICGVLILISVISAFLIRRQGSGLIGRSGNVSLSHQHPTSSYQTSSLQKGASAPPPPQSSPQQYSPPPPPPPSPSPQHSQEPPSSPSTMVTIECPGCQERMKIPKLGQLQQIRCEGCGLEGELEV